jgi:inorganic triphosphatase YgiF
MQEILEREDKWDVGEQFELPDLGDIIVGGHVDHDTVDLTSVYYDTPERDLLAHGVLLRRAERC